MGKHSVGRHTKKEKKKSKLISLIMVVIIIIIGVILLYWHSKNTNKSEPEKVVQDTFIALKEGKEDLVKEHLEYERLISSLDEMILKADEKSNLKKELFREMDWNIENVKEEQEKVEVVIEVTNKDFKEIITRWLKELVKEKSEGKVISQEIGLQKLEELVKNNNNKKTVIKKIKLNHKEENWSIEVNDDLRDLIFPGIDSVATILN